MKLNHSHKYMYFFLEKILCLDYSTGFELKTKNAHMQWFVSERTKDFLYTLWKPIATNERTC